MLMGAAPPIPQRNFRILWQLQRPWSNNKHG
jgi:hypothetical protein